jgi:hypothetical protein
MQTKAGLKPGLFLIATAILLVGAVGMRPSYVGSDTNGYEYYYWRLYEHLSIFMNYEYLYQFLAKFLARFFSSHVYFFTCIAAINCLLISVFSIRLAAAIKFRIEIYILFLLVGIFLFLSPFFFAAMVNVIRQGTAVFALFIAYLSLAYRFKFLAFFFASFIALGFHHSSAIALAFSPLLFFRQRILFWLVMGAACLYLTGASEKIVYLISHLSAVDVYGKIQNYGSNLEYKRGIRLDFTLFTLAAGLGFTGLVKYTLGRDERLIFNSLLKIYWVFVLPFFFLGFGGFSDRYLLAGWLFLSILMAVFVGLHLKKYSFSVRYLYGFFSASAAFFLIKAQGLC